MYVTLAENNTLATSADNPLPRDSRGRWTDTFLLDAAERLDWFRHSCVFSHKHALGDLPMCLSSTYPLLSPLSHLRLPPASLSSCRQRAPLPTETPRDHRRLNTSTNSRGVCPWLFLGFLALTSSLAILAGYVHQEKPHRGGHRCPQTRTLSSLCSHTLPYLLSRVLACPCYSRRRRGEGEEGEHGTEASTLLS